jgi:hypothetical protein
MVLAQLAVAPVAPVVVAAGVLVPVVLVHLVRVTLAASASVLLHIEQAAAVAQAVLAPMVL